MIFERQRLLLTMLDALGGPVANTDFQKLLFLYTKQCETSPTYEFVPYRFGAFSFTSYADKRRLTEAGCLTDDENHWHLSPEGRQVARKEAVMPLVVARFCRAHATLRGNALIAEQYRKFPYYATRSEILDIVLRDSESRQRVIAARPKNSRPGLLTIGYEARTLEGYLNLLLTNSVTLLCDVRRNPLSRKYGFSKSSLSKACEGVGIDYEHLPELGIDSEERRDLNTQADYDALFADYERKSLPHQTAALSRIRGWVQGGERVALTCFERLPEQCHRHCVAKALAQSAGKDLVALHL
jgi:uncharacterized protein (DUF488 family)